MVYDSEFTGRLARSKRELERLFKFLSRNLSTCGWKIMSSEPRQSPALCEFDTILLFEEKPTHINHQTGKKQSKPPSFTQSTATCSALEIRQRQTEEVSPGLLGLCLLVVDPANE